MALKIDHRFWYDQEDRTSNFECSTHINGVTYVCREYIDSDQHRMSGEPPDVVWNRMRSKLTEFVKQELFKE